MKLEWKNLTVTKTSRYRREVKLTGAELREALGLTDRTQITVHVPGGGDWSNTDLDLDDVTLDIVEVTDKIETENLALQATLDKALK